MPFRQRIMTENEFLLIEWWNVSKGVENENMKRKKDRMPKIVIKIRNGGHTKLYVNGKWQRKVTDIDFHGYVGDNGIIIECEYEKMKLDKNGYPIVKDNELVKEKHIVRIWRMNNYNITTCRYNADWKCTNDGKRKECVRVSKAVLLIDDLADTEVPDSQLVKKL